MRVLVTGTEGYIGTIVAADLSSQGHEVIGFDTGFYAGGWLYTDPRHRIRPRLIHKDIRSVEAEDLKGIDAVVHLAELSNDPLGEHNPEITFEINHGGSLRLAQLAKEAGIERFVYTSSCSVYGIAEGVVDERSETSPQTAYAKCKVAVENDLHKLTDDSFAPVMLRNATAYGASPRMRFDIVLNNLAGCAKTTGEIVMTSDGTPWRPLVHIGDISKAIGCALEAPIDSIRDQVFNVGDSRSNYQIREVAEIVRDKFPGCELRFGPPSGDNRSYKVSFDKIANELPGFSCEWDAEKGAAELASVFERIKLTREDFEHIGFTRLKSLTYLQQSGQIDERFFWTLP